MTEVAPTHCGKKMRRSEMQTGRPWWCRVCGGTRVGNVFTTDPLAPALPPSPPPPTLPSLGTPTTLEGPTWPPALRLQAPDVDAYTADEGYAATYDKICKMANEAIRKLGLTVELLGTPCTLSCEVVYRVDLDDE